MKIFVRNDNRLYNITKCQNAFLYIMTVVKKSQNYCKKTHFFVHNDNCRKSQKHREKTYFFVHNDGLQKGYKTITKRLQKLQGCNKYLPLGARPVSAGQVRVYALSGAPCQYIRLKELRLGSWELRLAARAATFQKKLRFKGATL